MSKKTFKKMKLNKLMLGIILFLCFGVNVFAKCSDYGGLTSTKAQCEANSESGYACKWTSTTTNYKGGTRTTYSCVKSSNVATCKQRTTKADCTASSSCSWADTIYCTTGNCYHCTDKKTTSSWTAKTLTAKVNEKVKLTSDTTWCSFSDTTQTKTGTNATLKSEGHACYFTATKAGTYTVYDIYQGTNKYKYTITVTANATKSSTKTPTPTTYRILFDQNYGYGLNCDSGYTVSTAGVCSKNVNKGTTVTFPASSSSMYREGQGLLLGWTKTVSNGAPNCNQGVVEKDLTKSYTVNSNTDFYACYREEIGGYRFLQKDYVADGGSVDFSCGQQIYIEYCNKETDGDYCYYYENSTNSYRKIYRNKIAGTFEGANATCDNTTTSSDTETINGYRYPVIAGDDYLCGEALYITTCTTDICNYSKVSKFSGTEIAANGTIDRMKLVTDSSNSKAACETTTVEEEDTKCSNEQKNAMRTTSSYTICYNKDDSYDEVKEKLKSYYSCDTDAGYSFDETAIEAESKESCNTNGICTRTYSLTCSLGKNAKPTLSVSSGVVGSDGKGTITVKATAKEGEIVAYYASEKYLAPTNSSSNWKPLNNTIFTITDNPGVKYIWVKDSKGNISNAVSGAILDTVNNDTTIKKLELYDENGNVQTPTRVSYNEENSVKSSKYVMLSSDLDKESSIVADGFNPYDMEYKLEVSSPTVSVYATLTSTDSKYIDGYEPRTVNLDYGINTVLIKIQNKEGKVRTYTILVTRTDDRTSDNTLSDLSLSVGEINFNANVTDYKVEIPTSTTSVDVSSTIASENASYVDGYEPGTVQITGDTTVKLIKVKSQTGSTRTYVITFVKEGTDVISKDSLKLSDLVIPGVYMAFEEDVANYSLSVDYETDIINLNTVLKDENSVAVISIKKKSDTEYKTVSNEGIGLDVGENFIEIRVIDNDNEESYYRLTIIRKEFGLDISDDTTLKDLKVLGYDIKFDPADKEYTVRIKQEKSLVITAVPNSNRAEVFIRGNDELTGFSTVRIKVVAENGKYETYSIDIKKDAFNKTIEIASIIAGAVIILISSGIIIVKKKAKAKKEYFEE